MHQPQPTFEVNGTAIRRIRMRQGTEMSQLAEAAGISRSYLNRLEIGTRERMRPETYARLRDALKATDDQLLARSEDNPEER